MPKIPTYTQQATLTKSAPGVRGDASNFGSSARAVQEAGKMMYDVGQQLQAAKDTHESTAAGAALSESIYKIQTESYQDSDYYGGGDRARKKLVNALGEHASKINNPAAREKFLLEGQIHVAAAQHRVDYFFRNRQIEAGQQELENYVNKTKELYFSSSTPEEQALVMDSIKSRIDENVAAGIILKPDADKYKSEIEHDIMVAQAMNDIRLNPEMVEAELNKGKQGAYPDLPQKDRELLLTRAAAYKRRASAEMDLMIKEEQEANEKQAYMEFRQGKLSETKLQELYTNNGVTKSFGEKLFKLLDSEKMVKPVTDLATYNRIRELQTTSNMSAAQINQEILNSSDSLSHEDALRLIDKSYATSRSRRDELVALNAKGVRVWAQGQFVDEFSGETDKAKLDEFLYKFYSRVDEEKAEGERIGQIAQEVMKDAVKTSNPSTAFLDDVPNAIESKDGTVKNVYQGDTGLKGKSASKNQYQLGDSLIGPDGNEYVVLGFDSDGEPLVEKVTNIKESIMRDSYKIIQ